MVRSYLVIPIFCFVLSGLSWLSSGIERVGMRSESQQTVATSSNRREIARQFLFEDLDRLVLYEHYYHSMYGHFTFLITRIGVSFSNSTNSEYDIRVVEATSERLLVHALSEKNGKLIDLVSIDHEFQVHANFPIPLPRPQYLRAQALKVLKSMRDSPDTKKYSEEGIYKGYFKYAIRRDSHESKTAIAVGTRPPVEGVRLELNSGNLSEVDLELESLMFSNGILELMEGSNSSSSKNQTDQEFLAQKIFLGQIGRYARDRSELSKITRFSFEENTQTDPRTLEVEEIADSGVYENRGISSVGSPQDALPLEIEKINQTEGFD